MRQKRKRKRNTERDRAKERERKRESKRERKRERDQQTLRTSENHGRSQVAQVSHLRALLSKTFPWRGRGEEGGKETKEGLSFRILGR